VELTATGGGKGRGSRGRISRGIGATHRAGAGGWRTKSEGRRAGEERQNSRSKAAGVCFEGEETPAERRGSRERRRRAGYGGRCREHINPEGEARFLIFEQPKIRRLRMGSAVGRVVGTGGARRWAPGHLGVGARRAGEMFRWQWPLRVGEEAARWEALCPRLAAPKNGAHRVGGGGKRGQLRVPAAKKRAWAAWERGWIGPL